MKKLIVFGGGGYCGSVLVPQLLQEGWSVTVFDTFWYGTNHLPKVPNLQLIEGDVRDLGKVKESLKDSASSSKASRLEPCSHKHADKRFHG